MSKSRRMRIQSIQYNACGKVCGLLCTAATRMPPPACGKVCGPLCMAAIRMPHLHARVGRAAQEVVVPRLYAEAGYARRSEARATPRPAAACDAERTGRRSCSCSCMWEHNYFSMGGRLGHHVRAYGRGLRPDVRTLVLPFHIRKVPCLAIVLEEPASSGRFSHRASYLLHAHVCFHYCR